MLIISRVNCHSKFWQCAMEGGEENEQFICCTILKIVLVGKTILVKSKMFRNVCKYELHAMCIFMWLQQLLEMAKAFPCSTRGGGRGGEVFIYSIRAFKHSSIVSIVSIARSASTQDSHSMQFIQWNVNATQLYDSSLRYIHILHTTACVYVFIVHSDCAISKANNI